MFVLSFKTSKKRLLFGLGAALTAIVLLAVILFSGRDIQDRNAERDVQSLLNSYGWEVDSGSEERETVCIPTKFDDVYTQYNQLQKLQGFDLSSYRGKECEKYDYKVLNYPDVTQEVTATVLTYKGKIIGADIHSDEQNGFVVGLSEKSF